MAEHHESAMDYHEHRRTYDGFLRLSTVGTVWVLCVVATLALGGVAQHWVLGGFWLVVATIAGVLGLAIKGLDWKPTAVVLVLMLLTLLLLTR